MGARSRSAVAFVFAPTPALNKIDAPEHIDETHVLRNELPENLVCFQKLQEDAFCLHVSCDVVI